MAPQVERPQASQQGGLPLEAYEAVPSESFASSISLAEIPR